MSDDIRIPIQWIPVTSNDPESINKAFEELIRQLKYKSAPAQLAEEQEPTLESTTNTYILDDPFDPPE